MPEHSSLMENYYSNGQVLQLGIKLGEPILISPAEETKRELYFLSNRDNVLSNGKGNEQAGEVIKNLAKVFVRYYPLAGRLIISPAGRLMVGCNGEGVAFVVAEANCALSELGDMTKPDTERLGKLAFDILVTKFKCGEFSLGLCMNHCMFDRIAAMEFVNSWAETARGLALSIPPFLDRTILKSRNPPKVEYPHQELAEIKDRSNSVDLYKNNELLYNSFCLDADKIEKLKAKAIGDGVLKKWTTFGTLSSFVWIAESKHSVCCLTNKPNCYLLSTWYFGNGIMSAHLIRWAGEIVEKPLSFTVGLIQDEIKMVTESYVRSAIDYFEIKRTQPSLACTVLMRTWSGLSFHKIDFGWGEPLMSGPVNLPEKEVMLFLSDGKDQKGISLVLGLPAPAMKIFQEEMIQTPSLFSAFYLRFMM
ncbi:hypothetical protein ACJRO7_029292 [Eucalyptus globulus]|uniref:Omega-hydroxypalmitate O-feruloyl transferase n=1 Tax=Eucalyptus globulus TaxID=34317 RepID=A0ABD3K2N3_EUCGL